MILDKHRSRLGNKFPQPVVRTSLVANGVLRLGSPVEGGNRCVQGKDTLYDRRLSVKSRSSSNNLESDCAGPGRLTARTGFAWVMNLLFSAYRVNGS